MKRKTPQWKLSKPLYLTKLDDRYKKHAKQLKEMGFSDSETWALDSVICYFIIPRLKRFRELNNGFPGDLTEKSWNKILDKMIWSFEFNISDDNFGASDNDWKRYQEGMDLFSRYFRNLWW